jgi:hypothetical protein
MRMRYVSQFEIQVERLYVDVARRAEPHDGRQFRSECEGLVRQLEVHRLLANPVARDEQLLFDTIEQCEGEHAAKFPQALDTPGVVGVEDHLRVRMVGPERATRGLQFFPEFDVVVDLAVEDHGVSAAGAFHRLESALAQIDDAQSTVAEEIASRLALHAIGRAVVAKGSRAAADVAVFESVAVRAAMLEQVGGSDAVANTQAARPGEFSIYSAHLLSSAPAGNRAVLGGC